MRVLAPILIAITALASPAGAQDKTRPPEPAKFESARPYLEQTVKHLESTNPRVRYSAREALRSFAAQAVPMIKRMRGAAKNPHVQAFLDRTVTRIDVRRTDFKSRLRAKRSGRANNAKRARYDIDRVAMEIRLTFDQIGKLDPMLARHFKQVDGLWAAMRAAGGLRDKEAHRDLDAEIKAIVEKAEPKLRAFLDERQTAYVKRMMLGARGKKSGEAMPADLREWQRDLEARWKNREALSDEALEDLKAEWGEFKRRAYGGK